MGAGMTEEGKTPKNTTPTLILPPQWGGDVVS